jgi:elongation factor 1 alpha-like protein
MLSAGQIVCSPDKPIPMITAFEAQILTLDIRIPIIAGAQVDVHAQMIDLPGRVATLLGTGKKDVNERKNPRQVTRNSVAVVTVKLDRAVGMELYSDIRSLGRFMLRRQGETIAVGVVTKMLG